ncbi:MAG: hypothetical protein MUF15_01485 [Acidobacteria bacterium]|jgi:F-type H+-transporting ATPase subunit epsilon|nr:hypothetical protein [Acidobacteriota bacterium]
MTETIQLDVTTYTDEVLKVGIKEIYIPAFFGQVGILENHKPYISLLKAGEMSFTDVFTKKFHFYIRGGIIEARDNKISVICESIEKIEAANKKEIEDKLLALDKEIKSLLKIQAGMTAEEIQKMPDQLAEALKEQKEFEIKWKIIKDIEARK